ncbi:hypothetical protein QR680_001502 [Steinernema hermaphroditum]|uniref:Anti-silencing function protein 1 n=1 Tax=Steinernema hermaphroditum TaxID=289476 RepID=A0AA39LG81_9BILA|nr:hypothetical protein QR680_001502 [Steinernema hermaphroditum]
MSARVNVCNVDFVNNPAKFTDKFQLNITFEVHEFLAGDLEWELTYVGSASTNEKDQVLDSILIGPINEGRHKFVFEADAPNPAELPQDDIVGVTALLLSCKYNDQLFLKVGYFVSVEYTDEELRENPPADAKIEKLERCVKTDDVRVNYYTIKWEDAQPAEEVVEEEEEEQDENVDVGKENEMGEEVPAGKLQDNSPVEAAPIESAQ